MKHQNHPSTKFYSYKELGINKEDMKVGSEGYWLTADLSLRHLPQLNLSKTMITYKGIGIISKNVGYFDNAGITLINDYITYDLRRDLNFLNNDIIIEILKCGAN